MWTQFMDMHSGGGSKEKWEHIFIEAPEQEAKVVFYNRFGHNPERITCTCCGDDYSISEYETLEQATAYNRNCSYDGTQGCWVEKQQTEEADRWVMGDYITLEEYIKNGAPRSGKPKVIYDKDIKPDERKGDVPEQGYVWQD